jgi:hypothetical protein
MTITRGLGALVVALSLLDAVLTIQIFKAFEVEEANPFLAGLIEVSPGAFIAGKMAITIAAAVFLQWVAGNKATARAGRLALAGLFVGVFVFGWIVVSTIMNIGILIL